VGVVQSIDLSKDYIDDIGVADVHLFNAKGHALADDLHYDFNQPTSISFSIDYSAHEVAPYVINLAE